MNHRNLATTLSLALALGAAVLNAQDHSAKPEAKDAPKPAAKARAFAFVGSNDAGPKEKVTFLGVETGPVPRALAAHLGLPEDHGLTVNAVLENSPASAVLQPHDVLRKFEDQVLVDSRQLSVLIRAKKPGDDVKLTVVRAGKEQVITVKLGEREVSRGFGWRMRELPDGAGFRFLGGPEGEIALERLRELPGIAREELNDALRLIGREHGNWFGKPRVHVLRRGEKGGSTILNLAEGNFVFSDDKGSVEIVASAGDRQLTVKDAKGAVLYQGPINNEEQRAQLPDTIKERLRQIEVSTFEFEAGAEFEQEGGLLPPARPTKTLRPVPAAPRPLPAPSRPI